MFVDSIVEKVTEKLRENNNNRFPRQNIMQINTKHVQKKLLQQMLCWEKSALIEDCRIVEVTETDPDVEIIKGKWKLAVQYLLMRRLRRWLRNGVQMFAKEDSEVTKEITEEDDNKEEKKQKGERKNNECI